MFNQLSVNKYKITGAIAFGDSLSDEGIKYKENICGCFPFKWFLYHSDYNNFTNGHTWAYIFANVLNHCLKEKLNWLTSESPTYFKNVAEGGATAYNYKNLTSLFKYFKGFILSFFLGNIQEQATRVKTDKNILHPDLLGIIFAGANDLATIGYDDVNGVERAIQGIKKTIKILTNKNRKTTLNYLKHFLFVGLPNISETPRFSHKSEKEKARMEKACQLYNKKLQEFSNEYQYIDFSLCTLYKYANINCLNLEAIKKIEKGIVVVGEGRKRTLLFIKDGKFVTCTSNDELKKITVNLSKNRMDLFSKEGEIVRTKTNEAQLDEFIDEIVKKAKLNLSINVIDISIFLDAILKNPEIYGFTAGCAVYFIPNNREHNTDETLISQHISGNAILFKETEDGFLSYLIKEGAVVTEQGKIAKVSFHLTANNQARLEEKIKSAVKKEVIKLADSEARHDRLIITIIQSVIRGFKKKFHKEMRLAIINDSVLESIKKNNLNRNTIFWDDLHPARRLHELLALKITEFIKTHYLIQNPFQFSDDARIGVKPKLPENIFAESPDVLPSESALLIKNSEVQDRVRLN